jgi:hypothetical protein
MDKKLLTLCIFRGRRGRLSDQTYSIPDFQQFEVLGTRLADVPLLRL